MSQPFDKYATKGAYHWDWYDNPNWAWYKECVDRIVDFCKGTTIDLGCGDSLVAEKIMGKWGFSCIGLDSSAEGLRLAREKQLPVIDFDLEKDNLMFSAEYLCSLNTIEHLKTVNGIKNLIKHNVKKGAIIITDKATEHTGRYHEHEYTKEELLKTFKEFKPKYFEINSTEFGKPITFIGVEIRK